MLHVFSPEIKRKRKFTQFSFYFHYFFLTYYTALRYSFFDSTEPIKRDSRKFDAMILN